MRDVRLLLRTLALTGIAAACDSPADPGPPEPVPGPPGSIARVLGDEQEAVTRNGSQTYTGAGFLPDSLRVRLTSTDGRPVAGQVVSWTSSAGGVSPSSSRTDASGIAMARWYWSSPQGWASVGTYTATAEAAGFGTVTFTGHARAGVVVREISLVPDTVDVSTAPAQVAVTVRATDDRRDNGLTHVGVQFYNPTATPTDFRSFSGSLVLASGTPADGVWSGTVTVPQGAEPGAWPLGRLTLGWGCGSIARIEMFNGRLKELGLTHQLHVTAAATSASVRRAGDMVPTAREQPCSP